MARPRTHKAEEDEREQIHETYGQALTDFLTEHAAESEPVVAKLFSMTINDRNHKQTKSYLQTWEETPPDLDEIAASFGAGWYRIELFYTNKKTMYREMRCKDYHIDPRARSGKPGPVADLPVVVTNQPDNNFQMYQIFMAQMTSMLSTFMESMTAVIKAQNNGGQGFDMTRIADGMQKLVVANANNTMSLVNRLSEVKLGLDADQGQDEGEQSDMSVFDILKWAWDSFGKNLLTASPTYQKVVANQVKQTAEYGKILQNPLEYKSAYNKIIAYAPKEDVDRMLGILDVPTPEDLEQPASEAAEQ